MSRAYDTAEALAETSANTTATPADALTLVLKNADISSKTVAVFFSAGYSQRTNNSTQANATLQQKTSAVELFRSSREPFTQTTDVEWPMITGVWPLTFGASPGDQTVALQYFNESGTADVRMRDACLTYVVLGANDLAVSTTAATPTATSTAWQNYLTWTAPATATYDFVACGCLRSSATASSAGWRVLMEDGSTAKFTATNLPDDTDDYITHGCSFRRSMTSGQTIIIQHNRGTGAGTITPQRAAIVGMRVSDFDATLTPVEDTTARSTTSTTNVTRNAASELTATPANVPHMIYGSANINRTTNTTRSAVRFMFPTGTEQSEVLLRGANYGAQNIFCFRVYTPAASSTTWRPEMRSVEAGTTNSDAAQVGGWQLTSAGTANFITPSGSVTPTGALVKQTNKTLAGSSTSTGKLVKAVAKTVAGSSTPSGLLQKTTAKTTSGSSTPTGTMLRMFGRAVAGSIGATGSLRKDVTFKRTGSIMPAGNVAKLTTKGTFTGSITTTGVLVKQTGKQLLATISSSGTLRKDVTFKRTGSTTPTGVVKKDTSKTFVGSIAAAGALVNQVLKQIFPTGSITATGALKKDVTIKRTGSSTPSGVVKKDVTKKFTGSSTPSGALASLVSKAIFLAGVIASSGVLKKDVTKKTTGSVTPTGAVQKQMNRTVTGTITATGKVVKSIAIQRAGTITSTGSLKKDIARTITGSITAVGQLFTSGGAPLLAAIVGRLRTFGSSLTSTLGSRRAKSIEVLGGQTRTESQSLNTDGTIAMNTRREE